MAAAMRDGGCNRIASITDRGVWLCPSVTGFDTMRVPCVCELWRRGESLIRPIPTAG
jgi:hypothetical protein